MIHIVDKFVEDSDARSDLLSDKIFPNSGKQTQSGPRLASPRRHVERGHRSHTDRSITFAAQWRT
jgi:hypothetical protein